MQLDAAAQEVVSRTRNAAASPQRSPAVPSKITSERYRPDSSARRPSLLGRPVLKSHNVAEPDDDIVGVCGDWPSAVWGFVEAITISLSDQATLTDSDGEKLNLWQRNMIALRAECEVGFGVRDPARFVKLTSSGEIPPRRGDQPRRPRRADRRPVPPRRPSWKPVTVWRSPTTCVGSPASESVRRPE